MEVVSGGWRLVKYVLLPLIPLLALGVVLATNLKSSAQQRAVVSATSAAEVVARLGIQPYLSPTDLSVGMAPDRLKVLDLALRTGLLNGKDVVRIKVWNRDLRVVYSDDHGLIGHSFPPSEELESALHGKSDAEVSHLDSAEDARDRRYGELLEVYVPLRFRAEGPPAGAFELYLPYRPIAAAINQEIRTTVVVLLAGLVLLYVALLRIGRDSMNLRRRATESEHLALHDPLTALANRVLFRDRLEHALALRDRDGPHISVMFLDVDDFKNVNDRLGHQIGDELLVAMSQRLHHVVRPADTVARLGGDEFAILLEQTPDRTSAALVAERIMAALRVPFVLAGEELHVKASVGIAHRSADEDADELLRDADVAMYWAKTAGKGRYEFFNPAMHESVRESRELDAALRRALDRHEFSLEYRPIVELATGAAVSVEALLRWDHPEQGLLHPPHFITRAEESGLIVPLGRWVLEHACQQVRVWQTTLPNRADLKVNVSLSMTELKSPSLVDEVADVLRRTGLAPACLVLEVAESTAMQDIEATVARLQQLKDLGVRLVIDDFGTGYSSLNYLRKLPITGIKIDKSLVDDIGLGPEQPTLAKAIIVLGLSLGLHVVAEGIEHPAQVAELISLGCRLGQGDHFARPLDEQGMGALLHDTSGAAPLPALS
jgi:diguanylate cyclase (GGDEF)-like protein